MRIIFESNELMSMGEAARELKITSMTLHRWVNKGKIQAVRVGAYRAIPKSEVERLRND
jgi:excisionase family DNA binding protein